MLSRRLLTALGAAVLLATAGCGTEYVAGTPAGAEAEPAGGTAEERSEPEDGFDECSLAEPSELAESLDVEAMYVTARSTLELNNGSQQVSCTYGPDDVPGVQGLVMNTVVDTDPERFFAPFDKYEQRLEIDQLGERAELVAYRIQGGTTRFIEIRAIDGDRGIFVFYAYSDNGRLRQLEAEPIRTIIGTALERLPHELTIPDGTPEGGCADIDLEAAADVAGGELVRARSVVSDDGAMNCQFSGGGAAVEVTVVTDPDLTEQHAVPADAITHPDLGDGALMKITEGGTLDARVNFSDHLVTVAVIYGDAAGEVTEPRPDDVELVRSIAESVGEQD
ncbi:hypothetical protein [Actinophytocola gossypii]|uniref:hypothetical protein n=1 Tax=Actinophytocola gossypii TaxID=2812003 RepID=UPI0021A59B6E|nr:hypothetical protein [Actinophytocola gossypii]